MKKFYTLTAMLVAAMIACGSAAACDMHKSTKGTDDTKTEETGS